MRIIDKNTDFYDYLQNIYRDATVTFDRTDSFLLTKDMVKNELRLSSSFHIPKYMFALLQVCNTFWLLLIRIDTGKDECGCEVVSDYEFDLLHTWKNYDKKRCLISFCVIEFDFVIKKRFYDRPYSFRKRDMSEDSIIENIPVIIDAIKANDFIERRHLDIKEVSFGDGHREHRHIPILKASGVANVVDPLDIYISFEEYFSLEKQSQERTESVGITDREKIENHGFDTKVSFRGKAGK